MKYTGVLAALTAAALPLLADAQSSSCGPAPSGSIRPSVASGYRLQVVATGLSRPRGLALDSSGNLLVVEAGRGSISAHTFNETSGCLTRTDTRNVTGRYLALNHGIEMSTDGRKLYASSDTDVFEWDYNVQNRSISNQRIIISNMTGSGHSTRTLLLSRRVPGMMVAVKGSMGNLDFQATDLETGVSQVRAFNITDRGREGDRIWNYDIDGVRLGWGLRNEVGIAEHPNSGGIWGVENSADNLMRMGVDIHRDNPAEELNFFGYLNGTQVIQQGGNFGYPWCFTAWDPAALPNNTNLQVGSQFAIDTSSSLSNRNQTDAFCARQIAPRLSFQAHMAPLDIKFNSSGTQAWITFHGSWNRDVPTGYKLSVVNFSQGGEPTEPPNSTRAALDIVSNQDISACPGNCLRPAAMAIDQRGRIFMSSDSSGEIYLVSRDSGSTGTSSASPSASGSPTSTAVANAASYYEPSTLFGGFKLHEVATYLVSMMLMLL